MSVNDFSTFAPAKINLYLHITGRRDNGYHELDSLVVFANVGDRIRAKPAKKTTLEISGPYAGALESCDGNLVLRAFKALSAYVGSKANIGLRLEKNLPVASGIGGGSADASAVIKTLLELWEIHLDERDLFELALNLGADVPACLLGKPAYMSGVGEILEPVEKLPALPAVLVNPDIQISTSAVFKGYSLSTSESGHINDMPDDIESLVSILEGRRNDLYNTANDIVPEIANVLAMLESTSGCLLARMSGSGATCFGIYRNNADAQVAADMISGIKPYWWVVPTIFQGAGGQRPLQF